MPAPALRSGLDLTQVDPSIRVQDDLFGHVNGRWLRDAVIPADRSSDGLFMHLRDLSEQRVREIVEECAQEEAGTDSADGESADPERAQRRARIGALHRMFMDVDAIEEAGAAPLEPLLDTILTAVDHGDLAEVMSAPDSGASILQGYVWTDDRNSSTYQVKLHQSGLGLPDESYYRDDAHEQTRAAYVEHLARLAELAQLPGREGLVDGDAQAIADAVFDFETRLAAHHVDVVRARDREKSYNPMDAQDIAALAPSLPWQRMVEGMGAPAAALEVVCVSQPEYVTAAAELFATEPLEVLRSWLALRTVSAYAPYLASDFVDADFAFTGKVLSGAEELRERWKRSVGFVESTVGFDIGREYVQRHFPAEHKERMLDLVGALLDAYRDSISQLEWMTEATRERALEKLGKFTPKIGYPDQWRDYDGLEIAPGDLVATVRAAHRFDAQREYAKAGGPIDEHEWHMTPQTVNAYYNPGRNEIVFPAAILQPPFFDADAEDAVNFGGIGAVIGHEIGHGFDDQGSKFDGDGNLESWWTQEDRAAFEERTRSLITQFSQLSPRALSDQHRVNGALTIGENIGDLGGLTIALRAYLARADCDAPVLDGYTPIQRVFLSWATIWRGKNRDQEAIRRLAIDPHSPGEFRCNVTAAHLDAFYDAFDVHEGDGMYCPPDQRVAIW